MRRELIYELWMDLQGPRDKDNINDPIKRAEEEVEFNPLLEYLIGILIPREFNLPDKEKKNDEEDDEPEEDLVYNDLEEDDEPEEELVYNDLEYQDDDVLVTGANPDEEDEIIASPPIELDPNQKPSSFGISFNVNTDKPNLELCITWARYTKITKNDKEFYKRKPYGEIISLNVLNDNLEKKDIFQEGNGTISIYYKRSKNIVTDEYLVIIYFVNNLKCESRAANILYEKTVFQPQIRVKSKEGTIIKKSSYQSKTILELVYKNKHIIGRGYLCSAIWKEIDFLNPNIGSGIKPEILWPDAYYFDKRNNIKEYEKFLNCDIRSEFLPLYPIISPNYTPEGLEKVSFSPEKISEIWAKDDMEKLLRPIEDAYQKWIENNKTILRSLNPNPEEQIKYNEIINHQEETLKRIRNGIELILNDEMVRLAFCFANRSIYLSNFWNGKNFDWRSFQLTFFLLIIESIVNSNSEYRDIVDLLWIPTGGGKTEAYLAIICFNIAYRRLKVKFNEEIKHNGGGVSVITRYTLRLLTIQQFRRTMITILAADYLRIFKMPNNKYGWRPKDAFSESDLLYGSIRFSTGLWVGAAVTQNHLRADFDSAVKALQSKDYKKAEPAQIIECPVCKKSWLSIPKRGLPANKKNYIHWIFKYNSGDISKLRKNLSNLKNEIEQVKIKYDLVTNGHPINYFTLKLKLFSDVPITEDLVYNIYEEIFNELSRIFSELELCPTRCSRPGYFGILKEPRRSSENIPFIDFEIYCPNSDCDLNQEIVYIDGIPYQNNGANQIDTRFELFQSKKRNNIADFKRMPISAYTIDEQIYAKCPTVIVSTADKFARLAYEPNCGNIFGNVNKYNLYYGYLRYDCEPREVLQSALAKSVDVRPFLPPDLIIQDELHLMEGPLGSMFGLYEIAINALITQRGVKAKYIASTATIKNAENQVNLLFAKELNQFPPYGLDIDDSFFVRKEKQNLWKKEQPGRIYLGIYVHGKGPQLPNLRTWASLLQCVEERKGEPQFIQEIRNFYTLVGYFNTLHGLGNARAILRDDVVDRINQIKESSLPAREISHDKIRELSSLIDSTDIAEVLKELEEGGTSINVKENTDVILSTSMFGTGVDIPHLSLMTVQAQPKSTAQYIQATGRVGRSHGGLIVVQYRASRPRDQSHYELFSGYHDRIYLDVEPISVSPYSRTALIKAGGPVIIAFLRNMWDPQEETWHSKKSPQISNDSTHNSDFNKFLTFLTERLNKINSYFKPDYLGKIDVNSIINVFKENFDIWQQATQHDDFWYWQFVPTQFEEWMNPINVVLGDPFHQKLENIKVIFKNAPQSLREVEEVIGFKREY